MDTVRNTVCLRCSHDEYDEKVCPNHFIFIQCVNNSAYLDSTAAEISSAIRRKVSLGDWEAVMGRPMTR